MTVNLKFSFFEFSERVKLSLWYQVENSSVNKFLAIFYFWDFSRVLLTASKVKPVVTTFCRTGNPDSGVPCVEMASNIDHKRID